MHKCIPYAKSGALPLNEPGRLLERAECINAFPTKDPCKFQFDGAFRPVTFLPGYVERINTGHHRRAGGLPPPNCNDSGVFPLNGIRLYENVGNGLAHSVGEAALETVPIFEFGGLFIITSLWETACGEKAADAVGMSKPIPYERCATLYHSTPCGN